MSSRKLFSIFSNSYTITFSSFDHTIPVPETKQLAENTLEEKPSVLAEATSSSTEDPLGVEPR